MTAKTLLQSFLGGATEGKAASLSISGNRLFSYSTVIAQRSPGGLIVNTTRYSPTTSKYQNMLKPEGVFEVDGLMRGIQDLSVYVTEEGKANA